MTRVLPFQLGEIVRVVNCSRLWTRDSLPVPIDMASHVLLGRAGRVEHIGTDSVVTVRLLPPVPALIICDMPPHGLNSRDVEEVINAEPSALRRLPVIEGLAALGG